MVCNAAAIHTTHTAVILVLTGVGCNCASKDTFSNLFVLLVTGSIRRFCLSRLFAGFTHQLCSLEQFFAFVCLLPSIGRRGRGESVESIECSASTHRVSWIYWNHWILEWMQGWWIDTGFYKHFHCFPQKTLYLYIKWTGTRKQIKRYIKSSLE